MTYEEKIVWSYLRRRSLDVHFRKQVPFGPYILDFFCMEALIAVEIDGAQHGEKNAKEYDANRDVYLRENSIEVLRFSNREVRNNIESVITNIRRRRQERLTKAEASSNDRSMGNECTNKSNVINRET